jgi:hypothetical protein
MKYPQVFFSRFSYVTAAPAIVKTASVVVT